MECNFTLKHYRESLELAKEKGYVFSIMKDYDKNIDNEKVIFLRHDVDISIKNALKFSEIEWRLRINATYFFRVHADYNMFSFNNYPIIKKIVESGHEIGLHYEEDLAKIYGVDKMVFLMKAKKVLESVSGSKVYGITSHEPDRCKTMKNFNASVLSYAGLAYDGYSPKFIKDIKYISDSSCRWREGCMCGFIKKETPKLCILTHPFWWYDKSPLENY